MPRKPARQHLHYVPVDGATDYAVEIRQGRTARTIGRVSGGHGSRWIGLSIGAPRWSPWVATRREATAPLLAANRLELTGDRYTVAEVLQPGDVVDYRGSVTWEHGRYIVAGTGPDSAGRYTLLSHLTGDVVLRQVSRASVTLTPDRVELCGCGHPVGTHLPAAYQGACLADRCSCHREPVEFREEHLSLAGQG